MIAQLVEHWSPKPEVAGSIPSHPARSIMMIYKYFKSVYSEFYKIHWPTQKEVISASIIVIIISLLFGCFLFCIDFVMIKLTSFIYF